MEYKLADLLDVPKLQALMDSLDELYSIPSAIIDIEGNILTGTAWQDICTKFHRVNPESEKECIKSDTHIASKLSKGKTQVVYKCPKGLVDAATPIVVEGKHLGNAFTGQFFLEPPDEEHFRNFANKHGFDEDSYIEALRRVPIITEDKHKKNLKVLVSLTEMLAEQGLKQKRQIETEKALNDSHNNLLNILDSIHAIVYVADMDTYEVLFANKYLKEAIGDVAGKKCWASIQEGQSAPCDFCTNKYLIDDKGIIKEPYHWRFQNTANGRWYDIYDRAIQWVDGRDVRMEIASDITDQIMAEEKLRFQAQILDQVHDSVIMTDLDGIITDWNKGAEELYGYSSSEAIGQHVSLIYPQERHQYMRDLVITPLQEKGHHEIAEDLCVRKGGEKVYTHLSLSMINDSSGNPARMIGYSIDISERKQARDKIANSLKEKEVLLKEVHHRVKNNMAIISSLLNMQSAYIKDNEDLEMFKKSRSRIKSMALVHEKLYQSEDFAHIDIGDYISSLSSNVSRAHSSLREKVRVTSDIEDIEIDLDTLVPLGLLINELLSNAYKHAFDEADEGRLDITLKSTEQDKAVLTVQDNGKGLPDGFDIDAVDTLGLQIVNSLTVQIKGRLDISSTDGTTFTLTFPKKLKFAGRADTGKSIDS